MISSAQLISLIRSYAQNIDEGLIKKAYIFAMEAHGMQKRASGVPYFNHPAEVARILAELHMDVPTIVTGLLHDVIEDTTSSFEEIEEIFGSEIAFLVEGVTKLSRINYTSSKTQQAENFRKFLMAISQDIRVLIVKLADRLHNMRTLNYIVSPEKRMRISLETLEIYAPLAERIGMNELKDELEDIAFYNLYPNEYSLISMRLENINSKSSNFIQNTLIELRRVFKEVNIDATVVGRQKKAYSIWKKMHRRNVSLEQINDIIAFRVIVHTVDECYRALGVIHTNFQIMPGRFKDYISVPKLNGYRSLHTTVIGPMKLPMEVQIRTEEMHKVADEGIAAHWSYKSGEVTADQEEAKKYNWINSLLTILKNSNAPEEAMNNSKLEMFNDEVFCFTPGGDLIALPHGATAIDFAYEIHTDVGNRCIGVKINGKMSPFRTVLRNGDRVDVITAPHQEPDAAWAQFVVTGKAKSCIHKFIKSKEREQFIKLGLQLVRYVTNPSLKKNDIDIKQFHYDNYEKFYYNVGKGIVPLEQLWYKLRDIPHVNSHICLIDFMPGIAVHFAACCHPILDDSIVGIIIPNKGLEIHLANCEKANLPSSYVIKASWNQLNENQQSIVTCLDIVVANKIESFGTITNALSSNNADIINIRTERRSVDFFEIIVDIKVDSEQKLNDVQAALRVSQDVKSVRQLKNEK